ncbi:hypothetical protein K8F61_10240 [Microbacterium resistens]|uniref:Histidinol dehydrogenase n=1 Tax=Microbacterium resistens TaxID=156977 RepID=A0ABY3RQE5_9MICO|nr:hypothetical protein [Microbacterium resistens]UGS25084.1 hypothetical protein K8F61_10240 [Microbacterium resistens]
MTLKAGDRTSSKGGTGSLIVGIVLGVIGAGIAAYVSGLLVLAGIAGETSSPGTRLLSALGVIVLVALLVLAGTRVRAFALTSGIVLLALSVVLLSMATPSLGTDSSLPGALTAGCQVMLTPALGASLLILGLVGRKRRP